MASPISRWSSPRLRYEMSMGLDSPAARRFRDKVKGMPPCAKCGYPKNDFGATQCEVCRTEYPRGLLETLLPTAEEAFAESRRLEAEAMDDARGGLASIARMELEQSQKIKALAEQLSYRERGIRTPGLRSAAMAANIPASILPREGGIGSETAPLPPRRKGWSGVLDWFVPAHVRQGVLGWFTGRRS